MLATVTLIADTSPFAGASVTRISSMPVLTTVGAGVTSEVIGGSAGGVTSAATGGVVYGVTPGTNVSGIQIP